jgi:hypothetical protein
LIDHRAIVRALRQRDLPGLLMLHSEINAVVCEQTKKMLRAQAAIAAAAQSVETKEEEVITSF